MNTLLCMKFINNGVGKNNLEVVGMADIDLQKMLMDIIDTYGKNEGYAIPTISWSKDNMLSRYGEFFRLQSIAA